mgnify:CR=1 FL=1
MEELNKDNYTKEEVTKIIEDINKINNAKIEDFTTKLGDLDKQKEIISN